MDRKVIGMKKLLGALLVFVMVVLLVPVQTEAASFAGGKGTAGNPYLIKTAEQLNSMRDNLSAHYKLAANIDLSGISNWKAVGTWKKAFTGSLTCDTNASGKPLYAISNLTCTVTPTNYSSEDYRYEDFKSDGSSGWEAGLFGVCSKANISNIILLNVKVTNHAQGRSQQQTYKGQVVNNSVSQMCAGGLAGTILSSTVKNCGVTGKVSGASNHMGGFAGTIAGGSKVNRCYAIVDVNGTGEWFVGGFVGGAGAEADDAKLIPYSGKPTISECFHSGSVVGGWCGTGGFIGGIGKDGGTISDCWNEGHVTDPTSGRSFFGQDPKSVTAGCDGCFSNCYSLAGLDGKGKASTAKGKADCFVGVEADSKGAYPYQNGFTAGDKATINAAFANNKLWTVVNGSFPQLKNVQVIKTLAQLGTTATNTEGNQTSGVTSGSDTAAGTTADAATDATDEAVTDGEELLTEETAEGNAEFETEVVEYTEAAEMPMSEVILIIVLAALNLLTIIGCIYIIIRMQIHIRKQKRASAATAESAVTESEKTS